MDCLHCCALLLATIAGVYGSLQKPSEAADDWIVILPVDPCELLLNRRTGEVQREIIDQGSLHALALECLSRGKRVANAPSLYLPEKPKARNTRGLFKAASVAHGGLIYPGTKWCGPGNTARDFWDLGRLADEDRCCRMHDNCPLHILSGQCSHGICNTAPFTRSHCSCDENFRRCLQALKSPTADTIGALYFNVGNILCFAEVEDDNQLPPNLGYADISADHLRHNLEAPELWQNVRGNLDTLRQMKHIGCSRKSNCRYKFHTQKQYVEAANGNAMPTTVQRPRLYHQEVNSKQQNLVMDKRSSVEVDHQTTDILSKFFHHILRSTGILQPRN